MHPRQIEIHRAILELENPYPADNLISDYKSFLLVRDFLHAYKFNPTVFSALVDLANTSWDSTSRVSRLSLIVAVKRYGFSNVENANLMPLSVREQVFQLFRKSFEEPEKVTTRQLEEVQKMCTRMIRLLTFGEPEEQWLCDNIHLSDLVATRVLRYPGRSPLISRWVRQHYDADRFRSQRPILAGWLMDEDPTYMVDTQTLFDDFEYLNHLDIQAISDYEEEKNANHVMKEELEEFLIKTRLRYVDDDGQEISSFRTADLEEPTLSLSRRFYSVSEDSKSKLHSQQIPIFKKLRKDFNENIAITQNVTMLWAVAFSHLEVEQKTELLKHYYREETYRSFFKICVRFKMVELLRWLSHIK